MASALLGTPPSRVAASGKENGPTDSADLHRCDQRRGGVGLHLIVFNGMSSADYHSA